MLPPNLYSSTYQSYHKLTDGLLLIYIHFFQLTFKTSILLHKINIMVAQLSSIQEKIETIRLSVDNYQSEREVSRNFNERLPNRLPIICSKFHQTNEVFNRAGAVTY